MTGKLVEDFSHNDLEGVYTPYNDNPVNFEPFEIQSAVVRESTPTLQFEQGHANTRLILTDEAGLPSGRVPAAGSVTRLWFWLGGAATRTWVGFTFARQGELTETSTGSYVVSARHNRLLVQAIGTSGVEEELFTITSIPTQSWHYVDIYWFADEPSLGFTDDEIAAAVYNGSTEALIDTVALAPSEPYQYTDGHIGFRAAGDMQYTSYVDTALDVTPSTDVDFAGHATATTNVDGDLASAQAVAGNAAGAATAAGNLDRIAGVAGEFSAHAVAAGAASGSLAPSDSDFHIFETFDYVSLDDAFDGFTYAFQLNTATVFDGVHSLRAREGQGGTQTITTSADANATGYAPRSGTIVRFWFYLDGAELRSFARYTFGIPPGEGILSDNGGGYAVGVRYNRITFNVWENGSNTEYVDSGAVTVPIQQWNYADVYWFVENGDAEFTSDDIGVIVYDGQTHDEIGSVKATPAAVYTGGRYGSWNSHDQEFSTYIDALSTSEPFDIDRIDLAGEATATASAAGELSVQAPRDLSGTASAAGSLTGAVDVEPLITLGATVSAVGTASAALTVEPWPYVDIAGDASAGGAAAGGMTRAISLLTTDPWDEATRPRAVGKMEGSLFITQPHVSTFVGAVRASASLDADLDVFRRFDGAASAHALATGAFHTKQAFSGAATATGAATARLFRPRTQIGRLDLRLGGLDYQAPVYDPWTIDPSWLRVRLPDGGVGALDIVDPDVRKLRVRRSGSVYGVAMTADFLRGRFIARSSAEASIERVEHEPIDLRGYGRAYGRRYGAPPDIKLNGAVTASASASGELVLKFGFTGHASGSTSASATLDPTAIAGPETGYGRAYGRTYGGESDVIDDFTSLTHWSSENDPTTDGYSLDTTVYVTEGSSLHRAVEMANPVITDSPPGGLPEPPYTISFDARFSHPGQGRIHYLVWAENATYGGDWLYIRINQTGGTLEIREPGTLHAQESFDRTADMWYTCKVRVSASSEPGSDWHVEATLYDDTGTALVTVTADAVNDYPENYVVGFDVLHSVNDMYVDNWQRPP